MAPKSRRRKAKNLGLLSDACEFGSGEHQFRMVFLHGKHPRGPKVPQSYKMRCGNPGCKWEHAPASYALDNWCFQRRHIWDYRVGGGNVLHRECWWCGRVEAETYPGWVIVRDQHRDADT